MMVNFSGVGSFRIEFGLILQTLEICFKVSIDDEANLELVLLTVESHKGILLGHVNPHCFVVYVIFEVFVPGLFAGKSLVLVPIATIAAPE